MQRAQPQPRAPGQEQRQHQRARHRGHVLPARPPRHHHALVRAGPVTAVLGPRVSVATGEVFAVDRGRISAPFYVHEQHARLPLFVDFVFHVQPGASVRVARAALLAGGPSAVVEAEAVVASLRHAFRGRRIEVGRQRAQRRVGVQRHQKQQSGPSAPEDGREYHGYVFGEFGPRLAPAPRRAHQPLGTPAAHLSRFSPHNGLIARFPTFATLCFGHAH